MTGPQSEDELAEFARELKLLAEAVLERVEPVLRRGAATGRTDWESCSWCPVCAAAALIRGERHDVLAAIADHGTAIVTVLREALAGVPVEPVRFDPETGAPHEHTHGDADPAGAEGDPAPGGTRTGGPGRSRSGRTAEPAPAGPGAGQPESRRGSDTGVVGSAGEPGEPAATPASPTGADGAQKRRRFGRGTGYVDIPVTVRR